MAGEDDDDGGVIVSLPETEGEPKIVKVKGGTLESTSFNEDPVEDLKGQFAALTSRATSAEATAQHATQQLHATTQRLQAAESEVVSSQLDTVLSGIAAAEAEAANAEAAYATAFEAGDGPAMARAQRAIAVAVSRQTRLAEAKDDLEDAAKRKPKEPPQQRTTQQQPADPIERMIAANGVTPKSAAWLRAHPEAVTDPKLNARMLAAHNLAIADDVPIESEEYFRRIEEGIKPVGKKQEARTEDGPGRRPSSAATPVANRGGGLNGGGTEGRLTKREATSATDGTLVWNYDDPTGGNKFKKGDPIGLAEMARRKHEGMKNGLYDRMQYEA